MKTLAVRFDDEQLAKIKAGGGTPFVRALVDAAPMPKAPTKKPLKGGL